MKLFCVIIIVVYSVVYSADMMFALVRWTSGKESGTHTIIDAGWIRDVDLSTFNSKSGL